ncbi:MAG: hypothetical protein AAB354_00515 [candidate division KSB1 bacterium]
MKQHALAQRYLIQIDLAEAALQKNARVDLSVMQRLLDRTGIALDSKYAPVCINPQQRRFVVRGDATLEARHRAEELLGPDVKFFSDGRVQPLA